ncbi:hypothetical protein AKJ09_00222 [Labilithrix luteola]|uniref:Uncharacterized protein n=1 Tax=Labilithrix luteola TaxID=1391654 RepID=A0A0K1PJ38_9BACT|nr:hypothetical protein AKJ09_00222 [Labilithrix luteola]
MALASAFVTGCSGDSANGAIPSSDGGGSTTDERDDDRTTPSKDSGSSTGKDGSSSDLDAGTDAADAADAAVDCPTAPAAPDVDGPNKCGALDFGLPPAKFQPVKDDAGLNGGTLPPGIYDTVVAERATGTKGSWQETIVLANNGRFTRTRQIDPGTGNLGVLSYGSGTYSVSGNQLTMTDDCSSTDQRRSTLPYNVVTDECGLPMLQYSFTGFRLTMKRR